VCEQGSLLCKQYRGGSILPAEKVDGAAPLPVRSRDADEVFAHFGCDPYLSGRLHAMQSSAMICLARILLALVEGLGPELARRREVRTSVVPACGAAPCDVPDLCGATLRHRADREAVSVCVDKPVRASGPERGQPVRRNRASDQLRCADADPAAAAGSAAPLVPSWCWCRAALAAAAAV
jgi:hypothetical protein